MHTACGNVQEKLGQDRSNLGVHRADDLEKIFIKYLRQVCGNPL